MTQYQPRNALFLDQNGGHYSRHVAALTEEKLHAKADIAAELAYRDFRIAELETFIEEARIIGFVKADARVLEGRLRRICP